MNIFRKPTAIWALAVVSFTALIFKAASVLMAGNPYPASLTAILLAGFSYLIFIKRKPSSSIRMWAALLIIYGAAATLLSILIRLQSQSIESYIVSQINTLFYVKNLLFILTGIILLRNCERVGNSAWR